MEDFNAIARTRKQEDSCLQGRSLHCRNHQLSLVVVRAILVKQAINSFCTFLVVFTIFRKLTVALHCNGEKLKRLWAAVNWYSGYSNSSFQFFLTYSIASPINGRPTFRAHIAETRTKVSGLLLELQKQSFLFVAKMLCKVCIALQSFVLFCC